MEAAQSPLPGENNGPADAYRHIVGAGELRRRFGWFIAWTALGLNERIGTHMKGYPAFTRQMDEANNPIGLTIGQDARTYEEVVRRARAAVDSGVAQGGSGLNGTPQWTASDLWRDRPDRPRTERPLPMAWPEAIPSAAGYRFGGEQFRFDLAFREGTPRQREAALLERLTQTPVEEWSEPDVRGVINSRPYLAGHASNHAEWRARVQQYFGLRAREEGNAAGSPAPAGLECGGVAAVRAYTRAGPSGPVQVGAHSRAVSCD